MLVLLLMMLQCDYFEAYVQPLLLKSADSPCASAMTAMKAVKKKKKESRYTKWLKARRNGSKRAKKVSSRMERRYVFFGKKFFYKDKKGNIKGTHEWTRTHKSLVKNDLVMNKTGKVVSKKKSERGHNNPWIKAVTSARQILGLKGFVAVKKDSPVYNLAKEHHIVFLRIRDGWLQNRDELGGDHCDCSQ